MELIRVKKPKLSIDLEPLIDVVFQLLVFFMLTSTSANPAIKMMLPKATSKDLPAQEIVAVSIDQNQNIYINDQKTNIEQFQSDLKKVLTVQGKHSIHIRGDRDMPYKYFVQIMDLARRAGATQINIVHEKE